MQNGIILDHNTDKLRMIPLIKMHLLNGILELATMRVYVLNNESLTLDYPLHLCMYLRTMILENLFLTLE